MSITILKPEDIEDQVRKALADYLTVYVRPLPKNFTVPCITATAAGGRTENTIDTFTVSVDARAKSDAEAMDYLTDALGILEAQAAAQYGPIRNVIINSLASWGVDPVRPDLKLCTATVLVIAHRATKEINKKT